MVCLVFVIQLQAVIMRRGVNGTRMKPESALQVFPEFSVAEISHVAGCAHVLPVSCINGSENRQWYVQFRVQVYQREQVFSGRYFSAVIPMRNGTSR